MNNSTLIGNLTRDPELKHTQNGKTIATFTIAVPKNYNKDKTNFIRCQVWGNTAEKYVGKYAKKGNKLAVSGELMIDTWKDDDQKYHSKTYINVDRVEILQGSLNDDYVEDEDVFDEIDDEDMSDLPF